jgi:hypothetical protein
MTARRANLRPRFARRSLYSLAAFIALAGTLQSVRAADFQRVAVEPKLYRLRLNKVYTGIEVEAQRESRSSQSASGNFVAERLYLAPSVGAEVVGSIYHPNLFRFSLSGEGGYGWQETSSFTPNNVEFSRTDTSILQRYNFSGTLLANKPYAASFIADKGRTFREVDVFNRVTVDTESYGAILGYNSGPVPFSVALRHMEEEQSEIFLNTSLTQDTLELKATNERNEISRTSLFYNLGQYERDTLGIFRDSGVYQAVSLNDLEKFGPGERFMLNSALTYNNVDNDLSPSDNLNASESLAVEHSDTIQSFYDYNFNYFASGPVDGTGQFAQAALQHQLYQSLLSRVDIHGDTLTVNSPGSTQDQFRYGLGNAEQYSKNLGTWGRLHIGNSARHDWEERQSAGSLFTVIDERVTLVDGQLVFLKRPRVLAISRVTDLSGIITYIEGIDYELISHGELTEIRRRFTSRDLPPGATVLVDYTAASDASGGFTTFADQFSVRLELFENLIAVYNRLSWIEHSRTDKFVLEDVFQTETGVELSWRWFRAGAEYETRESNLILYRAFNLNESIFFNPSSDTTLSMDFRQRWAEFPREGRDVEDYSFVTRFTYRISRYLNYSVAGGVRWEQGGFFDQRQATARTELDFAMGKLKALLGYEFNNDEVGAELRERHFSYLRVRRYF